jgi:hypothetical protein
VPSAPADQPLLRQTAGQRGQNELLRKGSCVRAVATQRRCWLYEAATSVRGRYRPKQREFRGCPPRYRGVTNSLGLLPVTGEKPTRVGYHRHRSDSHANAQQPTEHQLEVSPPSRGLAR